MDPDPVIRSGICNFLSTRSFAVSESGSCEDARSQMQKARFHIAIVDLSLPNDDGLQLVRDIRSADPRTAVLVLTGQRTSELGPRALTQGARQVMLKPVDMLALHDTLLRLTAKMPSAAFPKCRQRLDPFVGSSKAIGRLREISKRVLASESPILLQGETGSGKGVLANWIHQNGPRADQPFLDLNCAGLSRELLESELFGHEKGAFTSAASAKQGLLEVADHGTVFLDEIGDIDIQVQPKLLKVLEDRVFRRLGDVRDRAVDIRLISATHRQMSELVRQQRFRSDLYFRVNIVFLQVPPLRERVEDIPLLVKHLLRGLLRQSGYREVKIANSAMAELQHYSWPGNIRELRNVLERAVLVAENDEVSSQHLEFQEIIPEPSRLVVTNGTLKQMESAYIKHVLHDECGSVERTARRLGIPRSSLYNKMKRFEIPFGTGRVERVVDE
jgi:DNA-binding NtrC family response regulator